jgi:hypothetical protein
MQATSERLSIFPSGVHFTVLANGQVIVNLCPNRSSEYTGPADLRGIMIPRIEWV